MGLREEKAEQTRNKLMANALCLFREKGYDGVSVDQITRAAGVAKGTFYSYFDTKSDIIVEEFWKIDRFYEQYALKNLHRYQNASDKLKAFTRAQMRYIRDEVGVENLKILYANQILSTGRDRVIVNPKRQWYGIISEIIGEAQKTGEFAVKRHPEALALEFNRSMRSIFLDWCIADGKFNLVNEALEYSENWLIPMLKS